MGNWGPKVGVGSRVRGEEWIQPTYRIKISLRLVWPTQCFNGYEHININRLPSKAGFLDALKNRRSQTYIPTKYPSAGVECCLPSGEPTLYGHHSPTSSATTSTWHLCTTELLTPSIRHSAGCLAHGKLSGTGRPCLPPPKRKLQDQVTIFDLLSEPWGALPPYRGEVLLLFPPHPASPMLSHSASSFSLWTQAQGRWRAGILQRQWYVKIESDDGGKGRERRVTEQLLFFFLNEYVEVLTLN